MQSTKSTKSEIHLRIPTPLYEFMRKLGDLEERSINWKMVQAVKEFAIKRGWKE